MTGIPTYREFRERIPAVDWGRLRFELDPSRKLAFGGGRVTLTSRLYGVAFALRWRVPTGTGQFGRGHGHWCWPWQWHAHYYAALEQAYAQATRRTPEPREVTGAKAVPLGPPPPKFTQAEVHKFRRAMKRASRRYGHVRQEAGDDSGQG